MLAFLALSAMVIIAAVIAVLSLWMNRERGDRISRQSIPIATTSLDLTRSAQRIVDAVPRLAGAKTQKEQARTTAGLNAELDRLNLLLDGLQDYDIDPRAAASIERAVAQFAANITSINRVVTARIALATGYDAKVGSGLQAARDIFAILDPLAKQPFTGLDAVLASDPQVAVHQVRLLGARSAVQDIQLLLGGFRELDTDTANARADRAMTAIRTVLPELSEQDGGAVRGALDVLDKVFHGSGSLGQQQAFEDKLVAAADQALAENADLADRFAQAVDRMIRVVKDDVARSSARAAQVERTAFWLLTTVVAATLIFSFLIVHYYVQRDLLARLTALTAAMMAIARGDLAADIPPATDDELGSMAMALQVFRDTAVKVRDSNKREIAEVRTRLHHAIGNVQEGFAMFDADDRLLLSNPQFGRLLFADSETEPAESYPAILRQLADRDMLGVDDPADWIERALSGRFLATEAAIWPLRDNRWIGATERRTDDGGTVMVLTDLTALKRHELELDQLVEKLRKASAAKSSFIANVSHELRTPLTAVLGFAQIVQNRLENVLFPKLGAPDRATDRAVAQVRENIGIMILEGQRLTKMINDVLDLEKIEAGQMVWEIEPLEMGSVIRQAAATTTSLYRKKGLELHIEVEDDLPLVHGDRDRLVQVVINLISNAVKFTERGHVACKARRGTGDFVSIAVSDTGVGIRPEDQVEVFEKFRQVGDTLTEKPTGTGLGLPICREIVEHLGGSITVESIAGFGSTFTFQLPAARSGAEPITARRNLNA